MHFILPRLGYCVGASSTAAVLIMAEILPVLVVSAIQNPKILHVRRVSVVPNTQILGSTAVSSVQNPELLRVLAV